MIYVNNFKVTPILAYRIILFLGILFSLYQSGFIINLYTSLQVLTGSLVMLFVLTYSKVYQKREKEEFVVFRAGRKKEVNKFKIITSLGFLFLLNALAWILILGSML